MSKSIRTTDAFERRARRANARKSARRQSTRHLAIRAALLEG